MKKIMKMVRGNVLLLGLIVSNIFFLPQKASATDEDVLNGAENYNDHYYKTFDYGMTWKNAKKYCEALGGHLAAITTEEEQQFIAESVEKKKKNSYWLGGYKKSNGEWAWITGETFSYTNWSSRQPDNYTAKSENALMMYRNTNPYSTSYLGEWNDINADGTVNSETFFGVSNIGFVCEWDSYDDAEQINISNATIKSYSKQITYNGDYQEPNFKIAFCGRTLKSGKDYTVEYANNCNIGQATIKVIGQGDFSGTKIITFNIIPGKVKGVSVKNNAKSKISVSWNKEKSGSGYEIQYSTKAKFSAKSIKNIKSPNTTKCSITNLKKGKKYYVRVRSYKSVKGKKYYGNWSKVKKISVRK